MVMGILATNRIPSQFLVMPRCLVAPVLSLPMRNSYIFVAVGVLSGHSLERGGTFGLLWNTFAGSYFDFSWRKRR